jgi:hypothetical protein
MVLETRLGVSIEEIVDLCVGTSVGRSQFDCLYE